MRFLYDNLFIIPLLTICSLCTHVLRDLQDFLGCHLEAVCFVLHRNLLVCQEAFRPSVLHQSPRINLMIRGPRRKVINNTMVQTEFLFRLRLQWLC